MRLKSLIVLVVIALPVFASALVNVNVSAPANNATVSSPVLFSASAIANHPITGWRIYVDNVSVYRAGATKSISKSINLAAGIHHVVIRAWASDGTNGSVRLTETVKSSISGPAQGSVTPASLAFGSVATNATSGAKTVKITNTGSATLNVTGVSISPSQFAVSGPGSANIAPGGSVTYNVTFTPLAVSSYSGTLSFTTNSAGPVAAVTLSGTGLDQSGTNANCSANTYYVSNSGNDNNSGVSASSPWKSAAKVVSFEPSLRPGDCVLFQRGGVWSEQLSISNVHGSQSYPVTFGNYGSGNLPVIDGGSTRLYGIVGASASGQAANSYVTIDGFEVRNATRGGIIFSYLAQPGITIQNNYVHHTGYGAYPGAPAGQYQVDDNQYGYDEGISITHYPNGSYGSKIINNTVNHIGGHNAVMVDNDRGSPSVKANKIGPGCSHNCLDFKRSQGMMIKQNIIDCSGTVGLNGRTYPSCNGNAYYAQQDDSGYTLTGTYEQNVAYGAYSGYGCFEGIGKAAPLSLSFFNNSCYGGGTGALGLNFSSCGGGSFIFKNNIFDGANVSLDSSCTNGTWDYNDKYNSSGGATGAHDMSVNPAFVNPAGMDFHLQPTSPVLNSGQSSILGVPYIGACGTSGNCP